MAQSYSAAVERAARGAPLPMEAMTTPVWHEHRAISAELRVQMNRTQRAAQASAERAAAAVPEQIHVGGATALPQAPDHALQAVDDARTEPA